MGIREGTSKHGIHKDGTLRTSPRMAWAGDCEGYLGDVRGGGRVKGRFRKEVKGCLEV